MIRATLSALLLSLLLPDALAAGAAPLPFEIDISKSRQLLQVKDGDKVVRSYRAAHGRGGVGPKRRHGDNKTPVGIYRVVEFKADSRFHYFIQLGYPNLSDAWHGYSAALIDASQFRAIAATLVNGGVPPQDTPLGGYIGIHGIGESTDEQLEIHRDHNWTEGCIALTNGEMNELRQYVAIGTRVVISE